MVLEIDFDNGVSEKVKFKKIVKSSNDIIVERKGENRIELFRNDDFYWLKNKNYLGIYIWIEAYLKNSKSYKIVRVRNFEDIK